ncbi:MAG: class I SAM-dependent methyltransferase, partial [Bacteroidota bacterium]|nr:class I SAM-dependent methyltransferase [Bacteroidota bacterium]
SWKDYELIDVGNGEKLERFGPYVFIRPEPQALWEPIMTKVEWQEKFDAKYMAKNSNSGDWFQKTKIASPWIIKYDLPDKKQIQFLLKFTAFKHLGVFPEQASNWEYLYKYLTESKLNNPKVLNLFAYTGGASLAAKAAGADVVHLDSVKTVVNWANDNMKLSRLTDIRWIVEDAMKFIAKEAKRGNKYNAIIMDPPSYGLGPAGERWKLEDQLNDLIKLAIELLDKENFSIIINTYSLNLSPLLLDNMVARKLKIKDKEFGELYVKSETGFKLPLGSYFRAKS